MKEVELTGTIKEAYEKLKAHVGQKICQDGCSGRHEYLLTHIDGFNNKYIFLHLGDFGKYDYAHGIAPAIFLCFERDEVSETFEEMTRRKQKDIFRSLK